MEVFAVLLAVGVIGACGYLIGQNAGVHQMQRMMQQAAIASGVAEYYLDEDNERQFRYKKTTQN